MAFRKDAGVSKAVKIVVSVLKDFGIDAAANEMKAPPGGAAWQISKGSADVMIAVNPPPREGANGRLRLVSPIVRFDGEMPPALLERLLVLNGTVLPGVAFGIVSGTIALVAERGANDLDRAELEELLGAIGHFADEYDDMLVEEFGGTRVCDLG